MLSTNTISVRNSQGRDKKYPDDTPQQQAKRHEIAQRYQKPKKRGVRGGAKNNVRLFDVNVLFTHRYGGEVLPDDDAGNDDVSIMLHHYAHCSRPEQCMRVWLEQRVPWLTPAERNKLIQKVLAKPLKWKAASLGRLLRLGDAERTLLGITTIRPFDVPWTEVLRRQREARAARERSRRAEAGAKPHAMSEAQLKPWIDEDCSESTYRRRKRKNAAAAQTPSQLRQTGSIAGAGDSNSCPPYTKYILSIMKHCHPTGAPPPQGGSWARTELDGAERIFMMPREENLHLIIGSSM